METLKFDLNSKGNRFKILNATNGGLIKTTDELSVDMELFSIILIKEK